MAELCFNCFEQIFNKGECPHCGYNPAADEGKYPAALKSGSILNGRYIVGRVLGQGGFGISYTAQDIVTRQRVAIKEYLPTGLASRELTGCVVSYGSQQENFEHGKDSFMDEANALAAFKDNPNVVNVLDFFEANGTAYFVMEFVQGRSLKEYVKIMGGKLGEAEANRILLPIMAALEEIHAKGLIHRDIAPDNIIVTFDGSAKLIDFGAARYSTGEKSMSLDVVLKHGYAPVEQYMRRGRQGPVTDVYAMAATYYYTVTGRAPQDSIERMTEDNLLSPTALGAKISLQVEDALTRGLEVQQLYRFKTMGELAAAIKGETVESPAVKAQPKSEKPAPKAAPKSEKPPVRLSGKAKKAIIFAAIALAACLALVIGIGSIEPKHDEPSWEFEESSGTLTLRGYGPMDESYLGYTKNTIPWKDIKPLIKKVVIKNGITSIGERAFSECENLKEVELAKSVHRIGPYAFYACRSLESVELPEGFLSIDKDAFRECSALRSINFPESLNYLGDRAFYRCTALEEAELKGVTHIPQECFEDCVSLRRAVIPEGVEMINGEAFYNCKSLGDITIASTVRFIEGQAFYGCRSLKNVVLPEELELLGDGVFAHCTSLENLILPESLVWIGIEVFNNCQSFTELRLPAEIEHIGAKVIVNCNNLTDVYYPGSKLGLLAKLADQHCFDNVTMHYNYTGE